MPRGHPSEEVVTLGQRPGYSERIKDITRGRETFLLKGTPGQRPGKS